MRRGPAPGGDPGGTPRLTIIRHHRVYAEGQRPLNRLGVSESLLRAQLELLGRLGLTPITVREGWRHLAAGEPGHRVALSFDDGYADNLHLALPALRAASARATFYLTAGLMETRDAPWWDVVEHALEHARATHLDWPGAGRARMAIDGREARTRALRALLPDFRVEPGLRGARLAALREAVGVSENAPCELMTWNEAEVLRDAGMEIGAHTLSHPHLSLLEPEEQSREIAGSITLIERRLAVRPEGLAYPGGDHDARTIEAARATGLTYAVTTRAGDNLPGAQAFELRRRGFPEGACLGPGGRFSPRLAMAELDGAFDSLRGRRDTHLERGAGDTELERGAVAQGPS
jgi:peptidoglycan/xylan/chitin deacetylase (PgdA/CDA1 family)